MEGEVPPYKWTQFKSPILYPLANIYISWLTAHEFFNKVFLISSSNSILQQHFWLGSIMEFSCEES